MLVSSAQRSCPDMYCIVKTVLIGEDCDLFTKGLKVHIN